MNITIVILIASAVLTVGLVWGSVLWVLRRRSLAEGRVAALGTPRRMERSANCAGFTSLGKTQMRGNGCLAAFDDELVFVRWVPLTTWRIPRSAITRVGRARTWLGTWRGKPMLEVHWSGPQGDSAAWSVVDPGAWERELDPAARR